MDDRSQSSLEIAVYERLAYPGFAAGANYIAYISRGGKFLPMRFEGADTTEARAKAVAWWTEQIEAEKKRQRGLQARQTAAQIAREKRKSSEAAVPTSSGDQP